MNGVLLLEEGDGPRAIPIPAEHGHPPGLHIQAVHGRAGLAGVKQGKAKVNVVRCHNVYILYFVQTVIRIERNRKNIYLKFSFIYPVCLDQNL